MTFSRIDRDAILGFLAWLENARRCSASTRNQRLMALRSFLDFAGQIDCTQTALYLSACNIPSKESHGRIVEFLTEPSLTALLQQPDPSKPKDLRNLVFMILMYDTAARCSELLDMKVCDLRLDANTRLRICTEKGAKSAQSHCSARRFSIASNICASFIRPQITTVKHHFSSL